MALLAAFGRLVNPVELFAAYGIANVAGALPVTPAGLGVIDSLPRCCWSASASPAAWPRSACSAWRLVNFWLPIPAGASPTSR